jgi:hypothetical protein
MPRRLSVREPAIPLSRAFSWRPRPVPGQAKPTAHRRPSARRGVWFDDPTNTGPRWPRHAPSALCVADVGQCRWVSTTSAPTRRASQR